MKDELLAKGVRIKGILFPPMTVAFHLWLLENYKDDLTRLDKLIEEKPTEVGVLLWAVFNQDQLGYYDRESARKPAMEWLTEIKPEDFYEKYLPALTEWLENFTKQMKRVAGTMTGEKPQTKNLKES